MMLLPGVGPVFQSQGLSVDPNPDPSPLTTDPSHAHLQNPPTEAPMVSQGQETPKPEAGGPAVMQMKTGTQHVTKPGQWGVEGKKWGLGGGGVRRRGLRHPCPFKRNHL
ncbi:uncharacterized protein LOC105009063 [Esox lucius]|uniref:uncharacterized protein LOC105009063 n=1 Tax=Esox lucius TaxID=8010 RepID=UPI0014773368|nr:uncharacterized protein LOC105009063 [Esox lucius]